MVAFGHTAIGAAVGLYSYQAFSDGDIVTGLLKTTAIGIASHYVADFIPHGHWFKHNNYKKYIIPVIICDLILSVAVFIFATYFAFGLNINALLYVLFGIGGSQLPDILDSFIYLKWLPKTGFFALENSFHQAIHWHGNLNKALIWGKRDIWQVSVAVLVLLLIINQ